MTHTTICGIIEKYAIVCKIPYGSYVQLQIRNGAYVLHRSWFFFLFQIEYFFISNWIFFNWKFQSFQIEEKKKFILNIEHCKNSIETRRNYHWNNVIHLWKMPIASKSKQLIFCNWIEKNMRQQEKQQYTTN